MVGVMDRWAVESWLLRMLAHGRKRGVPLDWSFYGAFALAGSRDPEATALGAQVVRSPAPLSDKLGFAKALRQEVATGGYDILHCHHDLVSGMYLAVCAGLPLRRRLVHVHNADESVLTPSPLKQAVLRPTLRRACFAMADRIVANSDHSLRTFLAGRAADPAKHHVNYYGIDPAPFAGPEIDRVGFRRELSLADDAPVLLFAGRMTPEKNPVFVVDILAALRRRVPGTVAVFAGAGDLMDAVRRRAVQLGQTEAVRLIGWRSDIAAVMRPCDWFVLPHPHEPLEGFGMAVVEAELAGLRLLLSLGVSDAPILPGAAWRRLSLDDGAEAWASAAAALWNEAPPSRVGALAALKASPMDMDYALGDLVGLHTLTEPVA